MRRLEKTIKEIGWTHAVPRLAVTDRVSQAFDQMSREVYDCVLVMSGDELAGIFTSRDFLNRVAAVRAAWVRRGFGTAMALPTSPS